MKPYPPSEIIDTAARAGGLVHVSVFLAQALSVPPPAVDPAPAPTIPEQPGIAKCTGAGLACCSVCVRALTHAAEGQQWITPAIESGACALYASLEHYGGLGGPA